jgi:hypothetical protein
MNEFVLALWAMTASHYQPAMRAVEPLAIMEAAKPAAPGLNASEQRLLQEALKRIARCASGKLRSDPETGWYIPEQKPGCG